MSTSRSSDKLCGPCDARHLTVAASVWCTSCDEGLCDNCLEHHRLSKGTRQHQTVPISDFIGIGSLLSLVRQECEEHGRHFDFYCHDHDVPCCVNCVTNSHKKCLGLKPIDESAIQFKSSTLFEDMERGIQDLERSLEELRSVQSRKLERLQNQKTAIQENIKTFRKKINEHLDKLESNLLCQLDSLCNEKKEQIDKLQSELDNEQQEVKQLKMGIKAMKETTNITPVFLASKGIEVKLIEKERLTYDICHLEDTGEITLKVNTDPILEDIIANVENLGAIEVSQSPCYVEVGKWKHKTAQLSIQPVPVVKDITNTNVELVKQIKFDDGCRIRDCCFLPDGRLLFVDNIKQQVLIYKQNGKFIKNISVNGNPHGVAVIAVDTVAVSSNQNIMIIDIDRGAVTRTIETESRCSGISYYNGHFYALLKENGVAQYDVHGNLIRTIKFDVPSYVGYLCAFNAGLCYTMFQSVKPGFTARCDMNGQVEWQSNIGDSGLAVDTDGNVFVTSFRSHTFSIISADGKRHKCLLCSEDGLNFPEGVDFNKQNNTLLLVTNCNGTAALYKLN